MLHDLALFPSNPNIISGKKTFCTWWQCFLEMEQLFVLSCECVWIGADKHLDVCKTCKFTLFAMTEPGAWNLRSMIWNPFSQSHPVFSKKYLEVRRGATSVHTGQRKLYRRQHTINWAHFCKRECFLTHKQHQRSWSFFVCVCVCANPHLVWRVPKRAHLGVPRKAPSYNFWSKDLRPISWKSGSAPGFTSIIFTFRKQKAKKTS